MGRLFTEDDLDARVLGQQTGNILTGLDSGVDGEFADLDGSEPFSKRERAFYRGKEPRPKIEFSEQQKKARNKAQQALAIISRERKKGRKIREYTFPQLIIYFLRNPTADYRNILQDIAEAQARRENGVTQQSNGSYGSVMRLLERHYKEYIGR